MRSSSFGSRPFPLKCNDIGQASTPSHAPWCTFGKCGKSIQAVGGGDEHRRGARPRRPSVGSVNPMAPPEPATQSDGLLSSLHVTRCDLTTVKHLAVQRYSRDATTGGHINDEVAVEMACHAVGIVRVAAYGPATLGRRPVGTHPTARVQGEQALLLVDQHRPLGEDKPGRYPLGDHLDIDPLSAAVTDDIDSHPSVFCVLCSCMQNVSRPI